MTENDRLAWLQLAFIQQFHRAAQNAGAGPLQQSQMVLLRGASLLVNGQGDDLVDRLPLRLTARLVFLNWLISTYLVLTFAELCLSPMGISFVSKVAPPKLKGFMMADGSQRQS